MIYLVYQIILVVWVVDIVDLTNLDTAYVKDPLDGKWYDCDDSRVSPLDSNIMTKAAYLLFYRKRNHKPDNFEDVLKVSNKLRQSELEKRKTERQEVQISKPIYSSTSAFGDSLPRYVTPTALESNSDWRLNSTVATANNSAEQSENDVDDESIKATDDNSYDNVDTSEEWGGDFTNEIMDEPIHEWPVEKVSSDEEPWEKL
jgi:hypothetical protein